MIAQWQRRNFKIYGYIDRQQYTVKPVYNDHLMGYFSAFWSSSRWPGAT